ncbi:hypothetical protein LVJ83_06605 [Uruburuella testudinis]|uniref:Uncharacterized protein n=1 Tax=Uruburuella testudinis TaxID=1282863 RepID=A0ABY4DWD6_9NEIS|nr:hypothetical protein [Uruburuella testudinis]UOO83123.1 hypothetical protein LVJ83_06605 [Uruburuella testudinis]
MYFAPENASAALKSPAKCPILLRFLPCTCISSLSTNTDSALLRAAALIPEGFCFSVCRLPADEGMMQMPSEIIFRRHFFRDFCCFDNRLLFGCFGFHRYEIPCPAAHGGAAGLRLCFAQGL